MLVKSLIGYNSNIEVIDQVGFAIVASCDINIFCRRLTAQELDSADENELAQSSDILISW